MISFESHWLGLTDYEASEEIQLSWAERVRAESQIHILGLEHPGVITLGKRACAEEELRWSPEEIEKNQLKIKKIDRGGQATLHSKGQLVIYPIVPITKLGLGVRDYVFLLQKTTQDLLENYKIESHFGTEPGLYTQKGKIAFCGIRVERGATRHGISLNVRNDLNLFAGIRSCGQDHADLDSMGNYQDHLELPVLFHEWSHRFKELLKKETESF